MTPTPKIEHFRFVHKITKHGKLNVLIYAFTGADHEWNRRRNLDALVVVWALCLTFVSLLDYFMIDVNRKLKRDPNNPSSFIGREGVCDNIAFLRGNMQSIGHFSFATRRWEWTHFQQQKKKSYHIGSIITMTLSFHYSKIPYFFLRFHSLHYTIFISDILQYSSLNNIIWYGAFSPSFRWSTHWTVFHAILESCFFFFIWWNLAAAKAVREE